MGDDFFLEEGDGGDQEYNGEGDNGYAPVAHERIGPRDGWCEDEVADGEFVVGGGVGVAEIGGIVFLAVDDVVCVEGADATGAAVAGQAAVGGDPGGGGAAEEPDAFVKEAEEDDGGLEGQVGLEFG